jgi:HEPN domain-containing protein
MTLTEVQALIEKAKESTDAARSLAKVGHYDFAIFILRVPLRLLTPTNQTIR